MNTVKKNYLFNEREKRQVRICNDFAEMYRDNPNVSLHRIFVALSEKYKVSIFGIRYILSKFGVYLQDKVGHTPTIDLTKVPSL